MTSSFLARALALLVAPIAFASAASAQGSWRGGSAPDTPIRTTALPPSGAAPGTEIADRYLERARSDRQNADLWVYCAAAAMKRSIAGDAAADAYARDIAATMKATLDDTDVSPCEDAILAEIWGSVQPSAMGGSGGRGRPAIRRPVEEGPAIGRPAAPEAIAAPDPGALTPAEEERLRRANAAADAQERARVAAQAAAQQRQSDAQARYERERTQYEADVAAARAADAAYQRQLDDRRRALESGQYREPQ